MNYTKTVVLFCLILSFFSSRAADTLKVTLSEAEDMFLKQNLHLLAQKFNIDEQKAYIIQARLWSNPNFQFEQNIYNPINGRWFDVTKTGETIAQIEQLFTLGGKRNKRVALEKINTKMAEYQFYDLLRTLRYSLRTSFHNIFYINQSLALYEEEISSLRKTVNSMQMLYEKGTIPLKDLARMRSFLFSIESEKKDVILRRAEYEAELKILLNQPSAANIVPLIANPSYDNVSVAALQLTDLQASAGENRYDLKIVKTQVEWEEQNLAYQKSLAVPDLTLGAVYDRAGNFIQDYAAVTLGIDLPTWNRNQGNVKAAKSRISSSKLMLQIYQNNVDIEVSEAYKRAVLSENLYNDHHKEFNDELSKMMDALLLNFEKRNVGIVEFIDFYESYKNSMVQMYQLKTDRINAVDEINFVSGTEIITYK